MTPEQSKYFDDMEFLFGSQGWRNVIEDITIRQSQEKENVLTNRQTRDDMLVMFGHNEIYNYLLSLEATLAEVKRQLSDE